MDGGNLAPGRAIRAAERPRVSRERPDSVSQLVVAIQLRVGELKGRVAPGETEQILDEIAETIQNIHESARKIGL